MYKRQVLASVTYNLGIYPAMHDFLMDMKALNLQNRTFAIIENGSWAVKSGDLMQKFVNDELKNMMVLNERLSLASSMGTDKRTELEALADAILELSLIHISGGYCPCRLERTEATKCMCQEFKDQIANPNFEGYCHCMLYYKSLKD